MKNLIYIFILASFLLCLGAKGQANLTVFRIKPDSVCPGDSIKVNFKITPPVGSGTLNQFAIPTASSQPYIAWSGNYNLLYSLPKEHFAPLAVGDSCYTIWLHTPPSITQGVYIVYTVDTVPNPQKKTFYVKSCLPPCNLSPSFVYTSSPSGAVNFSSTSTGGTPTVVRWNYGVGGLAVNGTNTATYTYTASGTYSVLLYLSAPGCTVYTTQNVSVTINTTGIEEYSPNLSEVTYFDLMGNKIAPRTNEIIIEQRGLIRKKVIFTTQ